MDLLQSLWIEEIRTTGNNQGYRWWQASQAARPENIRPALPLK